LELWAARKLFISMHPLASHFYFIGVSLFGPELSMTQQEPKHMCKFGREEINDSIA
jgi:hypothetical protein